MYDQIFFLKLVELRMETAWKQSSRFLETIRWAFHLLIFRFILSVEWTSIRNCISLCYLCAYAYYLLVFQFVCFVFSVQEHQDSMYEILDKPYVDRKDLMTIKLCSNVDSSLVIIWMLKSSRQNETGCIESWNLCFDELMTKNLTLTMMDVLDFIEICIIILYVICVLLVPTKTLRIILHFCFITLSVS